MSERYVPTERKNQEICYNTQIEQHDLEEFVEKLLWKQIMSKTTFLKSHTMVNSIEYTDDNLTFLFTSEEIVSKFL